MPKRKVKKRAAARPEVKTTPASVAAALKYYQAMQSDVQQVFLRMVELAKQHNGNGKSPWVVADIVHQEALFNIQERYLTVLGELGRILGPGYEAVLLQQLGYAFKPVEQAAS